MGRATQFPWHVSRAARAGGDSISHPDDMSNTIDFLLFGELIMRPLSEKNKKNTLLHLHQLPQRNMCCFFSQLFFYATHPSLVPLFRSNLSSRLPPPLPRSAASHATDLDGTLYPIENGYEDHVRDRLFDFMAGGGGASSTLARNH